MLFQELVSLQSHVQIITIIYFPFSEVWYKHLSTLNALYLPVLLIWLLILSSLRFGMDIFISLYHVDELYKYYVI